MKKYIKAISIIFPAYNEEDNIRKCVNDAECALQEILESFEIIVVNDFFDNSANCLPLFQ